MLTRRMSGSNGCAPTVRCVAQPVDLERLFHEFFSGAPAFGGLGVASPGAPQATPAAAAPPVNVWEDDASIHVEAELPGFARDEVDVTFEDGSLTIRAARAASQERSGETYLRRERSTSEFARTIAVGVDVEADGIVATLEDGVLVVTLPKSKASRAHKIQIRSK